ncbi:2-deoxy-D-gluconate 3-dehydrogenase [Metarhizium guizhouense ARSEF 977]|uniref:Hydroxynaphthalene reductase-like protein Arp2 n=1 Tax=Metarhizium guizhouense (strain ARSEF 977) TaxID=1276136 RepID=A0A0B4G7M0_METGA|nr:2-deoxy-D-gluconate 3-dehydrogenase [Metarhizium guizhouense ARSEF 977]
MSAPIFSLQGQTAVVTGCTRGIGQAVAIGLAEAGADVILVQVFRKQLSMKSHERRAMLIPAKQRDTSVTSTKEAIEKLGRKAWIYTADMADQQSVKALTPKILADGHEVRILVTCAGIQRRHPCEEFPDSDFNEVMQVNLNAVFTLCRDVGAHMLHLEPSPTTGRRGSIINFASLLTFQGGFTVPAYAASKGAVGQVTKSFANEWTSKGITVNAIAPGYIETDMNTALLNNPERLASISARIPAGRWGSPDDFKGTTVYLASRASAYVSGHTLVVDGGWMGR